MKISPVPIPETPRPESLAPKGIDNQNLSDGMPFLAVMNECQEESDPAVETQKPEAGTEAGGGARLDATVQKPDASPTRRNPHIMPFTVNCHSQTPGARQSEGSSPSSAMGSRRRYTSNQRL